MCSRTVTPASAPVNIPNRSNMETMEYEMARNMTLLFFLERLLDKGEPRTLHDLSCQFGAKGFTREMRQIAGGSQSGELGSEKEPECQFQIKVMQSRRHDMNARFQVGGGVALCMGK